MAGRQPRQGEPQRRAVEATLAGRPSATPEAATGEQRACSAPLQPAAVRLRPQPWEPSAPSRGQRAGPPWDRRRALAASSPRAWDRSQMGLAAAERDTAGRDTAAPDIAGPDTAASW